MWSREGLYLSGLRVRAHWGRATPRLAPELAGNVAAARWLGVAHATARDLGKSWASCATRRITDTRKNYAHDQLRTIRGREERGLRGKTRTHAHARARIHTRTRHYGLEHRPRAEPARDGLAHHRAGDRGDGIHRRSARQAVSGQQKQQWCIIVVQCWPTRGGLHASRRPFACVLRLPAPSPSRCCIAGSWPLATRCMAQCETWPRPRRTSVGWRAPRSGSSCSRPNCSRPTASRRPHRSAVERA